jgi:hypothetical protein
MLVHRVIRFFVCAVALILIAGCSSSSDSSSGGTGSSGSSGTAAGTTAYKGTFAGKGEGGSIDVSVANASGTASKSLDILAILQVTGTLKITGGATSTITGTYDDATKTLTITGGGYTFTGKLSATGITGSYSGPNGAGTFGVLSGADSKAYCGTYTGETAEKGGVWTFTVSGTVVVGSFSGNSGGGGNLNGTATADGKVNMTYEGGTATGTISGDTASGTASSGSSWTGKTC